MSMRQAIAAAFTALTLSCPLFGAEPQTALVLDLGKTTRPVGVWAQKGWRLGEGDVTPSDWAPISQGGSLQRVAKDENNLKVG